MFPRKAGTKGLFVVPKSRSNAAIAITNQSSTFQIFIRSPQKKAAQEDPGESFLCGAFDSGSKIVLPLVRSPTQLRVGFNRSREQLHTPGSLCDHRSSDIELQTPRHEVLGEQHAVDVVIAHKLDDADSRRPGLHAIIARVLILQLGEAVPFADELGVYAHPDVGDPRIDGRRGWAGQR